jgi:hypothetical protein
LSVVLLCRNDDDEEEEEDDKKEDEAAEEEEEVMDIVVEVEEKGAVEVVLVAIVLLLLPPTELWLVRVSTPGWTIRPYPAMPAIKIITTMTTRKVAPARLIDLLLRSEECNKFFIPSVHGAEGNS